jgi:hypothetical protein
MQVIVRHNHLAEPAGHYSLLLVECGTLIVKIVDSDPGYAVFAWRKSGNSSYTERAMSRPTIEEARLVARRA